MNLLKETIECIKDSGHTPEDIHFIGSESTGHRCTWEEFKVLADREYASGFGASEVATDLIIVFKGGQKMWRGEYDGSEWWEYSSHFAEPGETFPISSLFAADVGGVGWLSLGEIAGNVTEDEIVD